MEVSPRVENILAPALAGVIPMERDEDEDDDAPAKCSSYGRGQPLGVGQTPSSPSWCVTGRRGGALCSD